MDSAKTLRRLLIALFLTAAASVAAVNAHAALFANQHVFQVDFFITIEGLSGGPLDGQTIQTNGNGKAKIGNEDPPPSPEPIDIELVALSLVSVDPVPIKIDLKFPATGEIDQPSEVASFFNVFVEIEIPTLDPLMNIDPFNIEGPVGIDTLTGQPIFLPPPGPNVFFAPPISTFPILLVDNQEQPIAQLTQFDLTFVKEIPEPSAIALFILGLFGIAGLRRYAVT